MSTAEDLVRRGSRSKLDERASWILYNETIEDAARLLVRHDVEILPVVDEEEFLVGVVTHRDLVSGVVLEGIDAGHVTVGEIAEMDYPTVSGALDVESVTEEMTAHQVRELPVLDSGRLIGVVTDADVAEFVHSSTLREFFRRLRERETRGFGPKASQVDQSAVMKGRDTHSTGPKAPETHSTGPKAPG